MKVPDLNVLLYAVNADSPQHQPARKWLAGALSGDEPVGFAWVVLLGFLRLATRRAVFLSPLTIVQALDLIDDWLAQPPALILNPGDHHAAIMRRLLSTIGTAGNLTTDAHLAALAIEHRGVIISCDHDFGRFEGLSWEDPLASK